MEGETQPMMMGEEPKEMSDTSSQKKRYKEEAIKRQ